MLNRILVIDDNPAIYEDFCKVLCPSTLPSKALVELTNDIFNEAIQTPISNQYRIEYAQRGQDGVAMVQAALVSNDPYVVVFVDMRMPNGWNGLETISNLWLTDPRLQIVLCTAYSDYSWQEIRERLSTKDRFLILKKPFDNIEVQQMVETMINRQEAETLLIESRNLLETAQQIARIGYYTIDLQEQTVTRSTSLDTLFNIPQDYANSFANFLEMLAPPFREAFAQGVLDAQRTQAPFKLICQFRQSDQGYAWCIAAGHYETNPQIQQVKFIGTLQDITQTYELQSQLQLLDACVSQANEVVIITDARSRNDGGPRIVYVNETFTKTTGYSRDYAMGKTLDILCGPNSKSSTLDEISKAQAACQPVRVELMIYDASKQASWADIHLSPIRDSENRVTHWLHLQRDISAQKNILDTLTEKEYKVVATVARNSEMPLKDIADRLHISEHTLRNHLASIYEKLGVRNRLELYVFCSKLMADLGGVQAAPA